jgi:hypothetical protein
MKDALMALLAPAALILVCVASLFVAIHFKPRRQLPPPDPCHETLTIQTIKVSSSSGDFQPFSCDPGAKLDYTPGSAADIAMIMVVCRCPPLTVPDAG